MYNGGHASCEEHACKGDNEGLDVQIGNQKSLYRAECQADAKGNQKGNKHVSAVVIQIYRAAHAD